jgi:hypothetical protein
MTFDRDEYGSACTLAEVEPFTLGLARHVDDTA